MRFKLANEDRKKCVEFVNTLEEIVPLCINMLVSDLYTDK